MDNSLEKSAKTLAEAGVIAAEPNTIRLYLKARYLGPSAVTVLILGESGTGKDHLAKFIHQSGRRKKGAFLHINCAALPGELFESELFGYEPGAFTGALKSGKVGVAEAADGGTLFLDEIGDLALENQVKLLRFLETKEVSRLGSRTSKCVDVRLIAATNHHLDESVREGTFRADLFYRLGVAQIELPPLRKRPKDIVALITAFGDTREDQKKEFSEDALEFLCKMEWPGNIRELNNFLEKLYVLESRRKITKEILTAGASDWFSSLHIIEPTNSEKNFPTLKEAMANFEREYITKIITESPNLTEAAQRLGINLTTLNRKKRQLGIYKRWRKPSF